MPIMMIHIMEGRTQEQKEKFIAALTDAAESALQAPRESVRVLLQEMPKEHFGIGGTSAKKLGR